MTTPEKGRDDEAVKVVADILCRRHLYDASGEQTDGTEEAEAIVSSLAALTDVRIGKAVDELHDLRAWMLRKVDGRGWSVPMLCDAVARRLNHPIALLTSPPEPEPDVALPDEPGLEEGRFPHRFAAHVTEMLGAGKAEPTGEEGAIADLRRRLAFFQGLDRSGAKVDFVPLMLLVCDAIAAAEKAHAEGAASRDAEVAALKLALENQRSVTGDAVRMYDEQKRRAEAAEQERDGAKGEVALLRVECDNTGRPCICADKNCPAHKGTRCGVPFSKWHDEEGWLDALPLCRACAVNSARDQGAILERERAKKEASAIPSPLPETLPVGTRTKLGTVFTTEATLRDGEYEGRGLRDCESDEKPLGVSPVAIDWAHYRATLAKEEEPLPEPLSPDAAEKLRRGIASAKVGTVDLGRFAQYAEEEPKGEAAGREAELLDSVINELFRAREAAENPMWKSLIDAAVSLAELDKLRASSGKVAP